MELGLRKYPGAQMTATVGRWMTGFQAIAEPINQILFSEQHADVATYEAFTELLARDGYDLVLVARRRERLEVLAKRLGETHAVDVEVMGADLIDAEDLRTVEERAGAAPGLELLVNNAGFGTNGLFAESDPDAEAREIRLNVLALTRLTRAALPHMVERRSGAIINVSFGNERWSVYGQQIRTRDRTHSRRDST